MPFSLEAMISICFMQIVWYLVTLVPSSEELNEFISDVVVPLRVGGQPVAWNVAGQDS
jgi:hypothetical protein